jgi:hypothetical protein
MLRGDIAINASLPSLQHWIKPVYEGKISEFDHDVLGITINMPDDWVIDFPNNNYKFNALIKLLAAVVPVTNNIIIKEAEMVDSTWLDFYELYNDLLSTFNKPKKREPGAKKPTLSKYMRFTDGKVLKSFHMNCTPSTLAALNHFVKTKLLTPWEWVAASTTILPPVNMPDKLDDPFGEEKQTGVFYGIDGDGDFTSLNNIRSLAVEVNLFTSSVGSSNVQLVASIVCMAKTLLREGTAIIQITDIKPLNISNILILSSIFKKIELVQLSNLYIVGTGFKGITKTYLTRLIHILGFVRDMTSSYIPGIFPRSEIPSGLVMKLSSIYPRLKPIAKPSTWVTDMNIIDIKPHQKLF